jgi:diguanylate cyclase (GGDEF)-like protein
VPSTRPQRIIDPLSGGDPEGGPGAPGRLRLAGALLFGTGAFTLAAVLTAPDPDPSDHRALAICGALYAIASVVLLAWRRPPSAVLHAICPLGSVATTAAVAVAEPVGLTLMFYLWPMIVAAYFLPRREVAANFAFAMAACGVALALWVDPVLRLAMFMAVIAVVGVVAAVILSLREHVVRLVERLGALATHDYLTGALNRGAFEQRLEGELLRAGRVDAPCALIVLDVDHFKRVNDSFGHAAGDQVLRRLAAAVEGSKRRSDVFGRVGGEEFALLLPDTDLDGAVALAGKLRELLAAELGSGHPVTVSLGVADVETSDGSARGLLHSADLALYAAKRSGRDRVVRADCLLAAAG